MKKHFSHILCLFAIFSLAVFSLLGVPACEPPIPTNCADVLIKGIGYLDGVYEIDPDGDGPIERFSVFCDMTTDGGGWTLVMNIAPSDGNSVGYNNQAFWATDSEYGNFDNRFAQDYKSPAAYLVKGTYVMIESTNIGSNGGILGWRRWPLSTERTWDSFFFEGIISVHSPDVCETGTSDGGDVGTTSSWDDIIRQGSCLYSDVNPSASGYGDTIRLTTIAGNSTDNKMSGFASCIDCGAPWQGSGTDYMGLDRAGCNAAICAYNQICRVPSADCRGTYCNGTYAATSCGTSWNNRFFVR